MKLRHILIIISFVLINVLILFALLKSKNDNAKHKATTNKTELPSVIGIKVKNKNESFNIEAYGEVIAYNTVNVSSETQGKLIKGKVELKPGVKFRKGDLLFKIKDTEAIYNIRARKSGFMNLIASILPDIKTDFPNEFDKWNTYLNSIKLNQTLPILPSWKSNKEKVFLSNRKILSEYFTLKGAEEQLSKHYVNAPFSGAIKTVSVNEHSIVNPGTKVITIIQTSNFEIPLAIPLIQADVVKKGTKVKLYTTSGHQKATGTVIRISDVLDKKTQSITVYVKPSVLSGEHLIEGEYLKAELNLGKVYLGFRIPFQAVNNQQVYIYQKQDSTLKLKTITILNENEKGVFVNGLNDGEIVITQEVFNYTDTTKYNLIIK